MGAKGSKPATSVSIKKRLFRGRKAKSASNSEPSPLENAGQEFQFNIHDPGPPDQSHHDTSLDRDDVINTHLKLVEKLSATWPAYQFMNELNLNELDTDAIERMNATFQHLLNQNAAIRNLSAQEEQARSKQRQSLPVEVFRKRSQFARSSSYEVLDEDGADARAQLMAEVNKMREEAQKSALSRRQDGSLDSPTSTNSLSRRERVEEMKERLRVMEDQVKVKDKLISELQQKTKNHDHHHHHHHKESPSSHRKGAHSAEVRQAISDKVKSEHQRLEHVMMSEMKPEVDRLVRFLDDQTKYSFLCAVVMELYTICLKHRDEFDERLHYLLLHPAQVLETDGKKKRKLITLLRLPSTEERPRSTSKSYVETQEIPKALKREALKFVAATSPYLDTAVLEQEVKSKLSERYERITAKLQDNEKFNTFVSDCAKMTWQIRILEPPMRLSADLGLLFSDDLHLPYRSVKVKDAELEYYLWPVLMESDGTVACKGRVAFKVNTIGPDT